MKRAKRSSVVPRGRLPRGSSFRSEWWYPTVMEHVEADRACGREWQCACGACRVARRLGFQSRERRGPQVYA